MIRTATAVLVLALLTIAAEAQAQTAKNAAYFELGGSAVISSINYERRFTDHWAGRIGASGISSSAGGHTDTTLILPLTASWISHPRSSNHHLELGGGLTIATGDAQDLYDVGGDTENFSTVLVTGIAGYRYQKPGRSFVFRATFTPIVGGGDFLPWAGVSFGYAW